MLLSQHLSSDRRVALVGVGSSLNQDDAAGVRVIERLARSERVRSCRGLLCLTGGNAPENVTGPLIAFDPTAAVFVDVADLGREPGAVELVAAEAIGGVSFSSHTLPLTLTIAYLSGALAATGFYLVAIQPASVLFGTEVCPAVQRAIVATASAVRAAIPRD